MPSTSMSISTARTKGRVWRRRVPGRWCGYASRTPHYGGLSSRRTSPKSGWQASYLSAPLTTDDDHVGALNLYSFDDHGFSEIDEVLVQVFVAAVEGAVWNARRAEQWRAEVEGLQEAMKTRAAIEQAKGMLMVLHGISAERAFEVMVEQSQSRNIRVAAIAAEVVETLTKQ